MNWENIVYSVQCFFIILFIPFRALGDHFYKKNAALPLKEQMISALPDVKQYKILQGDEFIIIACDGIWYNLNFITRNFQTSKSILFSNHTVGMKKWLWFSDSMFVLQFFCRLIYNFRNSLTSQEAVDFVRRRINDGISLKDICEQVVIRRIFQDL